MALRPTRFISTVKSSFVHINPFVVLGLHRRLSLYLHLLILLPFTQGAQKSICYVYSRAWILKYITSLDEKGSSSMQYCKQGFIARSGIWAFLCYACYAIHLQNKNRPICLTGLSFAGDRYTRPYLANSIARVSRITLTLIVPGYCMVLSILVAISRASLMALRSSTTSGRTMTRTSRPALIA